MREPQEPKLELRKACRRLGEYKSLLQDLSRQNPVGTVSGPAKRPIMNTLKATLEHLREDDPVVVDWELTWQEFQDSAPEVATSDLLIIVDSVLSAAHDRLEEMDGDTSEQSGSDPDGTGGRPGSSRHGTPNPPSAAHYRPMIPAAYQDEWLSPDHVGPARERAEGEW
jgi:hypothetical protein